MTYYDQLLINRLIEERKEVPHIRFSKLFASLFGENRAIILERENQILSVVSYKEDAKEAIVAFFELLLAIKRLEDQRLIYIHQEPKEKGNMISRNISGEDIDNGGYLVNQIQTSVYHEIEQLFRSHIFISETIQKSRYH